MLKESGSGIRIGWYLRTLPVQRIWRDGGLSLPLWERLSEDSTVSSRPASPRVSRVLNWLDRLFRHTGWARVRAATEIVRGTSWQLMKVAEGVYRVPARAANAYLVEADNGLVLVDTGLPGSEKRILKAIAGLGREPSDVKLILLTHRHLDHIGSAAALKKETSGMLVSHPFEKPYVAGTLVIITPRAWSLYARIVRRVLAVVSSTMKLFRLIKYHPVHVDEAADEESVLEKDGLDGSIVWTPGHTKGSVSLFLNESKVAIIGDLLTSKRGKLVEPMFMENTSQTRSSVQRILDLDPVTLCPGHGKPLPPSTVRVKERVAQSVKVETKKEEDIDLEGLAKDLSAEAA